MHRAMIPPLEFDRAPAALARLTLAAIVRPVVQLVERLAETRRATNSRRALRALPAETLRDIGVNASEVSYVARTRVEQSRLVRNRHG